MDALLRLLMGPWTTYILWTLRQSGPMRFGAIRRTVQGVSAKVLTQRLRMLEQAGVIFREYKPRIPPEVVYGLTQRGRELGPVLDALDTLAQRWGGEDAQAASGKSGASMTPQGNGSAASAGGPAAKAMGSVAKDQSASAPGADKRVAAAATSSPTARRPLSSPPVKRRAARVAAG